MSRADLGYGVPTRVIGARAASSYGSHHWSSSPLITRMTTRRLTADTITNTLMLTAIAMVVTRTLGMATRAAVGRNSPPPARRRVVVGNSEQLPFADESFTAVLCTASFHHYPDPHPPCRFCMADDRTL